MEKRFVSIWLHYLITDWFCRRHPSLRNVAFVLTAPDHGRMIVTASNSLAREKEILPGMVLADARAVFPSLHIMDDIPGLQEKLLKKLATWCIRFAPEVAIDPPDGLILHATGCAHLWNGEDEYLTVMHKRISALGYHLHSAMAGSIGTAWAMARYGQQKIIRNGKEYEALMPLPPEALRLDMETVDRLQKLGLKKISSFISLPRASLRRRFGEQILQRIDEALCLREEYLQPVVPVAPYMERLQCLEPIVTLTGIEIALQQLLDHTCNRLKKEGKGLRLAIFTVYKTDNNTQQLAIGTNKPSFNNKHLFKLFETRIEQIEPGPGIELFTLEAQKVEDATPAQSQLWKCAGNLNDTAISELLDRIEVKTGTGHIHRYLPAEHYWPERSFKEAVSLDERANTSWRNSVRPLKVFKEPRQIEVTAPIPDYPPMMFRYKDTLHKVVKADGPERIEQEWWIEDGKHRDYYVVEDEKGSRYWLFRSGHYDDEKSYQWFIHGFFA